MNLSRTIITIKQLSQEVGIGIDTLRVWERRYGFPAPQRDGRGHRCYSEGQIEELHIVKRLQSLGYRPGKIFALPADDRRKLLKSEWGQDSTGDELLKRLIADFMPRELDLELRGYLREMGLENFIHHIAVSLIQALDRGWTSGSLSIAREHLVSDRLAQLLVEQVTRNQPDETKPRLLFLTLSGERHKLGLLMSAALFHQQGIEVILLNEELPLSEIPQTAVDLQVSGVAISFSSHYSTRQAKNDLVRLRQSLDQSIKLFAGGHAVKSGIKFSNIIICNDLEEIPSLCNKHFSNKPTTEYRIIQTKIINHWAK